MFTLPILLYLILDSETIYAEAYTIICAKYGKEFTWEMNSTLQGRQGHECAERICSSLDLPIDKHQFLKQCVEIAGEKLRNVKLMPGKNAF